MHSEHNGRHTATPGQVVLRSAIHKGALSSGFVLLKGRPAPASHGRRGRPGKQAHEPLASSLLFALLRRPAAARAAAVERDGARREAQQQHVRPLRGHGAVADEGHDRGLKRI